MSKMSLTRADIEASLPLTVLYPEVPKLDLLHFAAEALNAQSEARQGRTFTWRSGPRLSLE
jgi:hypothetical protein